MDEKEKFNEVDLKQTIDSFNLTDYYCSIFSGTYAKIFDSAIEEYIDSLDKDQEIDSKKIITRQISTSQADKYIEHVKLGKKKLLTIEIDYAKFDIKLTRNWKEK